jgi:magnesium chelatase subunit H
VVLQHIVFVAGFESFNADLYRKTAKLAEEECPELEIRVFSDRKHHTSAVEVEAALQGTDVFGSVLNLLKCE